MTMLGSFAAETGAAINLQFKMTVIFGRFARGSPYSPWFRAALLELLSTFRAEFAQRRKPARNGFAQRPPNYFCANHARDYGIVKTGQKVVHWGTMAATFAMASRLIDT